MSEDILAKIVRMRKADIERLGLNFGIEIPEKRRVGHTEFLGNAGAILEVKRASPSKGDIAPNLDPVGLATTYAEAHAQAVSVLTEGNFFKGSLRDLIAVADLMEKRRQQGLHACAVLRKDFLLYEDEIDIAYRCGADAVLLIARILDDDQLVKMAKRAQSFDMQAFVEVREKDDFRKLSIVTSALGADAAQGAHSGNTNGTDGADVSLLLLQGQDDTHNEGDQEGVGVEELQVMSHGGLQILGALTVDGQQAGQDAVQPAACLHTLVVEGTLQVQGTPNHLVQSLLVEVGSRGQIGVNIRCHRRRLHFH